MSSQGLKYPEHLNETMKLHHIGYACENIKDALHSIRAIYKINNVGETIYDPIQKTSLCFLTIDGAPDIELVSGEPVNHLIDDGMSIYHACYEVNDLQDAVATLKEEGGTQLNRISPAKLFDNRNIVFIQTKMGLIELLEACTASSITPLKQKIILAGTFTTVGIKKNLVNLCDKYSFPYHIESLDCSSIHIALADTTSPLHNNQNNQVNIICIRECDFETGQIIGINKLKNFIDDLKYSALGSAAQYILILCPSKNMPLSNNESNILDIEVAIENQDNITLIDSKSFSENLVTANIYNEFTEKEAAVPYRETFDKMFSAHILKTLYASYHNRYKVIAVDCDNTLWSGVCGEDPINEIQLTDANLLLQKKLISLKRKGFLICLCSKNNEMDVRNVFSKCPGMLLGDADITAWQVNWDDKVANLVKISQMLNLPLSGFIFIDDSLIECQKVVSNLPDVFTLPFTNDFKKLSDILENLWVFDKPSAVTSPKERSNWYASHLDRERGKSESKTITEFLDSLELEINIENAEVQDSARISELSYRVTQFNFSNESYSKKQIQQMLLENKSAHVFKISLKDKYGDYGLVGVIIGIQKEFSIIIDTFLLSCRALDRGVEHKMLNHLISISKNLGVKDVYIPFNKSERNMPAKMFLDSLGGPISKEMLGLTTYIMTLDNNTKFEFNPEVRSAVPSKINAGSARINDWKLSNNAIMELLDLTIATRSDVVGSSTLVFQAHQDTAYTLIGIWEDLLEIQNFDKESSFFDLGGDSLLALRLAASICAIFNIDVRLYEIFENATFSKLLAVVENKLHTQQANRLIRLPQPTHYNSEDPVELASNQKSLWLLDKLYDNSWFYNISSSHKLTGKLNIAALSCAIKSIILNNSALRSYISLDGVLPKLAIDNADQNINFKIINTSDLDKNGLLEMISSIQLEPFNLYQSPLYRIRLLKISATGYILVLVFHHLIFDGWSEGLFNKRLSIYYKGYSQKNPSKIQLNAFEYRDYSLWQHQIYKSELYEKSLNYWVNELKGFSPLKFPTTYPRPSRQDHKGRYQYFKIPNNLTFKLKSLSKDHNTTIFCLLYSALSLLIYKLTKQTDITIGFPISGRVIEEFEDVIGNFVSTRPLRFQIKPHMTINEVISNAHRKIFDAYEHQFAPFQDIVKNISNDRDGSNNPIYQIMIVLQDATNQRISLPNIEVDFYKRGYDAARMDFIMEFNIIDETLDGGVYYNTALFDSLFMKDFVNDYIGILNNICFSKPENINDAISHLYPKPPVYGIKLNPDNFVSVTSLFESFAQSLANKVAVKFNNTASSYFELNSDSNQLAVYLSKKGILINDIVALHLNRNKDIIICILACFKLGVTYVPIDPEYPMEYKKHIIADSNPCLLITNTGLDSTIHDNIIDLTEFKFTKKHERINTNATITAKMPAYIIYTSGTTGAPKGVVISHGALSNLVVGLKSTYNLSSNDSGLLFHSYCFDFSVWEIWSVLAYGGTLVILNNPATYSANQLWDIIVKEKISILNQTPTVFENNLLDVDLELLKHKIQLRLVIFGGEPLYPQRLASWFKVFSENSPEIYNMYGITETTVHTTYQKIDAEIMKSNKSLIGKAIPGVEVEIFDDKLQPSKIGDEAEIHVSGNGLSSGYLNREDLTMSFFINIHGKVWYRTGDLGKKTSDNIEYIGRIRSYIKLRGYRIDPNYVASEIEKHSGIDRSEVWANKNFLISSIVPDKATSLPIINYLKLAKEDAELATKTCVLPNGMRVLHHNKPETLLQYQEIFIDKEYMKHNIVISENDTIIDVGANIGLFSLFFGSQINNVKIFAFEPIPELHRILVSNLKIYGVDAYCSNYGISDKMESSDFTYYPSVSVLSGKNPNQSEVERLLENTLKKNGNFDNTNLDGLIKAKTGSETFSCDFVPLSHIIDSQDITTINLLKVDVERHELEVLQGIREEQWGIINQIVIEVHDFDGRLNTIKNLLLSHGFSVNLEQPHMLTNSNIWVLYASKQGLENNVHKVDLQPRFRWSSFQSLESDVKAYLKERIPHYMIPAKMIVNDKMPINKNAKFDSLKINDHYLSELHSDCLHECKASNSELKTKLTSCWRQVLDIESCDLNTNFFDMGGDSFSLLALHSKICDEITTTTDLLDLFSHTTINQQANLIALKVSEASCQ